MFDTPHSLVIENHNRPFFQVCFRWINWHVMCDVYSLKKRGLHYSTFPSYIYIHTYVYVYIYIYIYPHDIPMIFPLKRVKNPCCFSLVVIATMPRHHDSMMCSHLGGHSEVTIAAKAKIISRIGIASLAWRSNMLTTRMMMMMMRMMNVFIIIIFILIIMIIKNNVI